MPPPSPRRAPSPSRSAGCSAVAAAAPGRAGRQWAPAPWRNLRRGADASRGGRRQGAWASLSSCLIWRRPRATDDLTVPHRAPAAPLRLAGGDAPPGRDARRRGARSRRSHAAREEGAARRDRLQSGAARGVHGPDRRLQPRRLPRAPVRRGRRCGELPAVAARPRSPVIPEIEATRPLRPGSSATLYREKNDCNCEGDFQSFFAAWPHGRTVRMVVADGPRLDQSRFISLSRRFQAGDHGRR
jgi:hypothetical protein